MVIIIIIIKGRNENKMQEFMYGDVTNVEHGEMCDNTGSNWSHRNSGKRF